MDPVQPAALAPAPVSAGPAPAAPPRPAAPEHPARITARTLWTVAGAALLVLLVWHLSAVLMLAFAGVLLAIALRAVARPLETRLGLSPRPALALVIAAALLLTAAAAWLAGAVLVEQLQVLRETLPRSVEAVRKWLDERAAGRWLLDLLRNDGEPLAVDDVAQLAKLAGGTFNVALTALGSAVLAVVLGVYLAADPRPYRRGLLRLMPPLRRADARHTLDHASRQLERWLLGQAVSMSAVAVLTAIGLTAIGMPAALTLAAIAGALDFVPYFGPIAAGVLITVVALPAGEAMALQAVLVCLVVQQLEGYVVQPLAQRWAVRLPPAASLLSVLVFGILFGIPGVLLAVPLTVLTIALVDSLYVRRIESNHRAHA